MPARRNPSLQEVPEEFAALLRRLHDDGEPVLNLVLAAARDAGWRTPALAATVELAPSAVSKRVERARRIVRAELEQAHRGGPVSPDDVKAAVAGAVTQQLPGVHIPKPQQPPRVTLDGKQLPGAELEELRRMQRIASRVNGATPADHPDREVSEKLSARLDELVRQGYTPYYLAREIPVSHRAITSRLERHRYREPCPSVAGTASGEYHRRKIGDPGQGAPRVPAELREQLRQAWRTAADGDPQPLRNAVGAAVKAGFTMANIAHALPSTPSADGRSRRHVGLVELERRLGQQVPA